VVALAKLPGGCRALIVDGEPLQALALECLLEELGCQPVGPARSVAEVEQRLRQEHPNFALVDCGLVEWLTPLAACLDRSRVPFALLAVCAEGATLDRIECVRDRPRLTRPYHGPSLHAVAVALYRADLRAKIEEADRHLVEGRSRLARQLRLIERLEAAGQDTALANALAREYGRLLRMMRASRALLGRRLDNFSDQQDETRA
jgi:hypothetical protein